MLKKPAAHPALSARLVVQLAVLLLTLAVGVQFALFWSQVSGPQPVTVSRPAGVEGFLPIGALMAWKQFILSGHWDRVHPAAMVILGFAALISLLLHKTFCGWFCPLGTLSEGLWRLGRAICGRNLRLPAVLDFPLRSIKYGLLGFFVWIIASMGSAELARFLQSPYYQIADVKMLHFFTRMSATTAVVLAALAVLSLFYKNFWCRYACPYGALMGILAMLGPSHIRRDAVTCTACGRCRKVCPAHLPVPHRLHIRSAECSGCLECVRACPAKGALRFETKGMPRATWTTVRLGLAIALIFLCTVYGAKLSGHWQSRISPQQLRTLAPTITADIRHPSTSTIRTQ